jgi:hypothetical protein
MIMNRYRKKPVVIEAVQWGGGDVSMELANLGCKLGRLDDEIILEVPTLAGTMIAYTGDYITRDVEGRISVCELDVFAMTYGPIEGG